MDEAEGNISYSAPEVVFARAASNELISVSASSIFNRLTRVLAKSERPKSPEGLSLNKIHSCEWYGILTAILRTAEMTGRRNKNSLVESILQSQSRRSERVRKIWQKYQPQQILGARKEVRRTKRLNPHQFSGYPKLSGLVCDEFEALLETTGLTKFYSCLEWDCPPNNLVKHFVLNLTIVKKKDGMELKYLPLECQSPLIITMDKLARALRLSPEGICQSPDTAAVEDVKTEMRFKLDSSKRYFSVFSAETKTLFVAAKFANQALFLQSDNSILSLQQMILFRAALNGTPVAWGQVLWKNLVRRISRIRKVGWIRFAKKMERARKVKGLSLAAVVVALLLRVAHGPEHEAWYRALPGSRPKGSYSDSDESDHDNGCLIDAVTTWKQKKAKAVKEPKEPCSELESYNSDREFLIDLAANNRRKRAKIVKEENDSEENPPGFAVGDSTFLAEDVETGKHMMMEQVKNPEAGTDDLAEGPDAGSEDLRGCSFRRENVQSTTCTTNLFTPEEEEGEVPMIVEESETHHAALNKKLRAHFIKCHFQANSSDLTSGNGNSTGIMSTLPSDSWPGNEQQTLDGVQQLSSGNDSSNAAYLPDRFNVQTEQLEVDVDRAAWKDYFSEATEEHRSSSSKLKAVTAEPEERACAANSMEDGLGVRREHNQHLHLQMVNDGNKRPTDVTTNAQFPCELENLLILMEPVIHVMSKIVEPRASESVEAPSGSRSGSVVEIVQVPASTLVKMVHIVKHFLHGLEESGVPPNVCLKLKAERFMEALKLELESRGLQEFIEQKELFGVDWSMDKIFDAQWSLQDRLRNSEKECLKLKAEVDEIFAGFNLEKPLVSLEATNSAPGPRKPIDISHHDRSAATERALPLYEMLKSLRDKMKCVKGHVKMMEVGQERQRRAWLKQRDVLVQRWNGVKFDYFKQVTDKETLEAKFMVREDTLRECEEKLQRESMRASFSEVTISNLREEVLYLKNALTEKHEEIRKTLTERDEAVQTAKHFKENFAMSVEELQRKDKDLMNALTRINDLKQRAETTSDRLKAQQEILNGKNEEVRFLEEEISAWMAETSACKVERETLSKERGRVELQRMNQTQVFQEMEENTHELKGKLEICKDRIKKLEQQVDQKDHEVKLLKVKADTAEEKLLDCKKRRDLALDVVHKHRDMQDANKKQIASLKEEREKTNNQLEKVLKREFRLLQELEGEKERLEEGILDHEQQDIWSIEEVTQNHTAADMRKKMVVLRAEKKEIFLSAFQRLRKIIDSYKMDIKSYGPRSSGSSAG